MNLIKERLRSFCITDDLLRLTVDDAADHIEAQERRIAELEAARIAYANEFPLNADGEPDVGSIHQNIRLIKAQLAEPANVIDADRYRYLSTLADWRDIENICRRCVGRSAAEFQAQLSNEVDAAIVAMKAAK